MCSQTGMQTGMTTYRLISEVVELQKLLDARAGLAGDSKLKQIQLFFEEPLTQLLPVIKHG